MIFGPNPRPQIRALLAQYGLIWEEREWCQWLGLDPALSIGAGPAPLGPFSGELWPKKCAKSAKSLKSLKSLAPRKGPSALLDDRI